MKFFLIFLIFSTSSWACHPQWSCEMCHFEECVFVEREAGNFLCMESVEGSFGRLIFDCSATKTTSSTEKVLTHEEWLRMVFRESEMRKQNVAPPSIEETTTTDIPLSSFASSSTDFPMDNPVSPNVMEREVRVLASTEKLSDRLLIAVNKIFPDNERNSGLYARLARNFCNQIRTLSRLRGKKIARYFLKRNPWANYHDLCENILMEQRIRRGFIKVDA